MTWLWLICLLMTLITAVVTMTLSSACGTFTGYQALLEVPSVL